MYNLSEPHLRIVGKNQPAIIVQNGLAFEHGSRKALGRVHDVMKEKTLGKHDYKLCQECGGTFTSSSDLEAHFVARHREVVLASVSRHAPKNIKGIWAPTEEMIEKEAKAILAGEVGTAEDSEKPKKSWREKV